MSRTRRTPGHGRPSWSAARHDAGASRDRVAVAAMSASELAQRASAAKLRPESRQRFDHGACANRAASALRIHIACHRLRGTSAPVPWRAARRSRFRSPSTRRASGCGPCAGRCGCRPLGVPVDRRFPIALHRLRVARRRRDQRLTVRIHEPPRAVVEPLDADAAFVHLAMMEAAQRDEIAELGLAAFGPVMHVMAVHVLLVRAAGEDAAFVA